jgi:hypothetical protein
MRFIVPAVLTAALLSAAHATPLTRYFPDFPLAVLEARDLQQSVAQTGSFGEDTLRFLSTAFDDVIVSEGFADFPNLPAPLRTAAVRTMVASIRDLAVGAYTVGNSPQALVVVRFTPNNPLATLFARSFNDALARQSASRRLREGNYVALIDDLAVGVGNNLFYLSTNADLLRAYLRRVNGAALPTLSTNAAYNAVTADTGTGFWNTFVNASAIARVLERAGEASPRELNVLRTLNLTGGAATITADGMETKSVTQLNPNGGDAALYKLLTYKPQDLELLRELPSNAPNASVLASDTAGWLEYAQGWFAEAGLSAAEQRQAREVVTQLGTRLGNEWGVVGSASPDPLSLVALFTLFGVNNVTENALPFTEGLFKPTDAQTAFYAKTQNGAQVLTDLETAFKNLVGNDPSMTVERISLGGFEALKLESQPTSSERAALPAFFIVDKNDTIVIGSDETQLEAYLTATPLLENPLFAALQLPTGISGVNFSAPLRPTRAQIDADIEKQLSTSGINDIPAGIVTAYGDWLESYTSRTGITHGYWLNDENKMRLYSKNEFAWNR